MISKPPQDVLRHVVDVHCHPTDSEIRDEVVEEMSITICAMATKPDDQALVAELANKFPTKVIPCFGPSECLNQNSYFFHVILLIHRYMLQDTTLGLLIGYP